MPNSRRSKVAVQIDMFRELDRTYIRYEAIWLQLENWIKNLKTLRAQLRYSEYPANLKYTLEVGLTRLGGMVSIYQQSVIASYTRNHKHDTMSGYADKMAEKGALSMDHTPESDYLAEWMTNSLSRLKGIVLANKDLIGDDLKSALDLHKKLLILDVI